MASGDMDRAGALHSGTFIPAIYLAAGTVERGRYRVRGAYGNPVGVAESFALTPEEWRTGPFVGVPVRRLPRRGETTIGGCRFQTPLLRAAERLHGPVVWVVIRRPICGDSGDRGYAALGVREADGEPVAIVSQTVRP